MTSSKHAVHINIFQVEYEQMFERVNYKVIRFDAL